MKTFTKTLIALFTTALLYTTCKPIEPPVTVNPTITLSQGDDDCELKLSGDILNELTRTKGNNLVTWVCGTGVEEIVSIFKKSGDDVFQVGPKIKNPNKAKSDWFGITKNTTDKLTEEYGIIWKDSDGNSCTHDPSIKINQ
jgi:hypothetical protein